MKYTEGREASRTAGESPTVFLSRGTLSEERLPQDVFPLVVLTCLEKKKRCYREELVAKEAFCDSRSPNLP